MVVKNRRFLLLWVVLLSTRLSPVAQATILLKPNGEDAMLLRTKSLNAQVTISGQFATTRTEMVFQNETSQRIEADFIYTAPHGAVVTYFVYWFGKEKVVARVVEKERATAIYSYITAPPRQRDPALIELIGKNTFRARIFPVEPNADLKVELRMVQALHSYKEGAFYEFPLRPQEESKGTFDALDINVLVKPEANIERVSNSYNLPVEKSSEGYRFKLSQANFRPQRDLRIDLVRKPRAVQAALYAAPSGGTDGFFALALTPSQALRNPVMRISGVPTYGILPARLPNLAAHQAVHIYGRYKGHGAATVRLTGWTPRGRWSTSQSVNFGAARIDNNLATKLWAAERIAQLSARKNCEAIESIVELSMRFSLPSKFTSWLAVPQAEMERYQREQAGADMYFYGRLLAGEIAAGREKGRAVKRLRVQLDKACRLARSSPADVLHSQLNSRMSEIAYALVRERYSSRPNRKRANVLQRELKRLADASGTVSQSYVQQSERVVVQPLMYKLANELMRERYSKKPNRKHTSALRRKISELARRLGDEMEPYLDEAESNWMRARVESTGKKLAEEILSGREDSAKAQQLQKMLDALDPKKGGYYGYPQWMVKRAYQARAHETAYNIAQEKKAANPDAQRIASLGEELKRLVAVAGNRPEAYVEWEQNLIEYGAKYDPHRPATSAREYFMHPGDPLLSIDAPADAAQVIALMPDGAVKKLIFNADSKKWEARFDIPTYAAEGQYLITVVIVLKDATRRNFTIRYHVDVTAPHGNGGVAVLAGDGAQSTPILRLELDAGEDTARVFALLPWGDKIELKPSTVQKHRFFALAPVPDAQQNKTTAVTYMLTDRAHNRTTLTVDMTK